MFNPVCFICLDEPVDGEESFSSLRCGHIFHKSCVDGWMQQNHLAPSCPQCHTPCDATQLTDLVFVQVTKAPTAAEMEEARMVEELEAASKETEAKLRDVRAGAAASRGPLRQQDEAARAVLVAVNEAQEALNNPGLAAQLGKFRTVQSLPEELKKKVLDPAFNLDKIKQELKPIFKEFLDAHQPVSAGTPAAASGAPTAAEVQGSDLRRSKRHAVNAGPGPVVNSGPEESPKRPRRDMPKRRR